MTSRARNVFGQNVTYVRNLVGLARALAGTTTPAVDLSDLLRASLVLLVSAFDTYVHERVRAGMLEAHRGVTPQTPSFAAFSVSMSAVGAALADTTSDAWLETEIRRQHGLKSFQKAEKVAEALRLVSTLPVWDSVAADLGIPAKDLRIRLDLIVDRRNQIAHEADLDPTTGLRWPISDGDVEASISFVEQLVDSLERTIT